MFAGQEGLNAVMRNEDKGQSDQIFSGEIGA
jgi:hypothetical protein